MVWREVLREKCATKNFTKNCGKNDQIWPKLTSKMASFPKIKQAFDQNQSDSESN